MYFSSLIKRVSIMLVLACLFGFTSAMAQSEPSVKQIYATAKAGNLDQAQGMIQQVIALHPSSAKAFFVQSELYVKQGKINQARMSLDTAEKLSPGLSFATPEAVKALQMQMLPKVVQTKQSLKSTMEVQPIVQEKHSETTGAMNSVLIGFVLILIFGLWFFLFKKPKEINNGYIGKRTYDEPLVSRPQPIRAYGESEARLIDSRSTASALQSNNTPLQDAEYRAHISQLIQQPPPVAMSRHIQPNTVVNNQGGGGSSITNGIVTGLAVGAGVVAATAIGRNMFGDHNQSSNHQSNNNNFVPSYEPIDNSASLGGENFGIKDIGSWNEVKETTPVSDWVNTPEPETRAESFGIDNNTSTDTSSSDWDN